MKLVEAYPEGGTWTNVVKLSGETVNTQVIHKRCISRNNSEYFLDQYSSESKTLEWIMSFLMLNFSLTPATISRIHLGEYGDI